MCTWQLAASLCCPSLSSLHFSGAAPNPLFCAFSAALRAHHLWQPCPQTILVLRVRLMALPFSASSFWIAPCKFVRRPAPVLCAGDSNTLLLMQAMQGVELFSWFLLEPARSPDCRFQGAYDPLRSVQMPLRCTGRVLNVSTM